MASISDICNAAISHCGTRSKITSIDEGSPEASACHTHFALARDSLLRAHDWNFARVTGQLGALQNPPARWAYKYAAPIDCLRLRRLNDTPLLLLPETFCEVAADKDSTGAVQLPTLPAPNERGDLVRKRPDRDRLLEISVEPEAEEPLAVTHHRERRQRHDGDVGGAGIRAEVIQRGDPVHIR